MSAMNARAPVKQPAPWIAAANTVGLLEPEVLRDLAPTRHPQGVLAVAGEPFFQPWDAVAGTAVWLDGVQDPGNVGAVIRAAAGLGAAAVLAPIHVFGSRKAMWRDLLFGLVPAGTTDLEFAERLML